MNNFFGRKELAKNSGLRTCFSAVVDRKQVNFEMDVLFYIIKKDLNIDITKLPRVVVEILPYMLVYYIRIWPGWAKSVEYFKGKLAYKDWYDKFVQYVVIKMNSVIEKSYDDAMEEIKKSRSSVGVSTSASTQTDNFTFKSFAPCAIDISCPPSMVNTIVFIGDPSVDNIRLRQHPNVPWRDIGMKELVHWPFCTIHFKSPRLAFTREVAIQYQRFICSTSTSNRYTAPEFLMAVSKNGRDTVQQCYSYEFLQEYIKQYKEVLQLYSRGTLNYAYYEDLCVLLDDLLKDVEEIGINNSLPTNTSVLFNIGKKVYTRNKKLSSSSPVKSNIEVAYIEYLVPRVMTLLTSLDDKQDESSPEIAFEKLKELKTEYYNGVPIKEAFPKLVFFCTFCNKSFGGRSMMIDHFQSLHKMEHGVMCINCKGCFSVTTLAGQRWNHECVPKGNCPSSTS